MILLALAAAARADTTASDVARGVNESMSQKDGTGPLIAAGAGVAGLLGIALYRSRRGGSNPTAAVVRSAGRSVGKAGGSPRALRAEVRKALGISRSEMRRLLRLARAGGWSDPLLPLLCPSLLESDLTETQPGPEQAGV